MNQPVNSSAFHDPAYQNSNSTLAQFEDSRKYAQNVTLGAYRLTEDQVASISGKQPMEVALTAKKLESLNRQLNAGQYYTRDMVHVSGNVIYLGLNSNSAEIGDVGSPSRRYFRPKCPSWLRSGKYSPISRRRTERNFLRW